MLLILNKYKGAQFSRTKIESQINLLKKRLINRTISIQQFSYICESHKKRHFEFL